MLTLKGRTGAELHLIAPTIQPHGISAEGYYTEHKFRKGTVVFQDKIGFILTEKPIPEHITCAGLNEEPEFRFLLKRKE